MLLYEAVFSGDGWYTATTDSHNVQTPTVSTSRLINMGSIALTLYNIVLIHPLVALLLYIEYVWDLAWLPTHSISPCFREAICSLGTRLGHLWFYI